jgi:hypothetical protein
VTLWATPGLPTAPLYFLPNRSDSLLGTITRHHDDLSPKQRVLASRMAEIHGKYDAQDFLTPKFVGNLTK